MPIGRGRNSARGQLHCTLQEDDDHQGTTLHIVIKPPDMRWFFWLFYIFLFCMAWGFVSCGQYHLLFAPIVMSAFSFLIIHICRHQAEAEIPMLQQAFASLIHRLERQSVSHELPPDRRGTIAWITFAANMLFAIPVCALLGCGLMFLCIHDTEPSPVLLWNGTAVVAVLLLIPWGLYQYRINILNRPLSPAERDRNLIILGLVLLALLFLFFASLRYLGNAPRTPVQPPVPPTVTRPVPPGEN